MNPLHKHKIMSVGYQVKQILKSGDMKNLNSLLKFWVWESGRKIDPSTGVRKHTSLIGSGGLQISQKSFPYR